MVVVKKLDKEEFAIAKRTVRYKVRAMIEILRAVITAEEIVCYAEFFSFDTNDLTQRARYES